VELVTDDVSVHGVVELVEIPNNKQIPMTEILKPNKLRAYFIYQLTLMDNKSFTQRRKDAKTQ
jgi:hypothetical protein